MFGAAYTILDVCDSDGEQLIKLRNPPGDHEVLEKYRDFACEADSSLPWLEP